MMQRTLHYVALCIPPTQPQRLDCLMCSRCWLSCPLNDHAIMLLPVLLVSPRQHRKPSTVSPSNPMPIAAKCNMMALLTASHQSLSTLFCDLSRHFCKFSTAICNNFDNFSHPHTAQLLFK